MFSRFLIVGSLGFAVDAAGTHALIAAGWSDISARPPAILLAMVVTWLANRQFTFRVSKPRRAGEFLRYGAVAFAATLLNFGLYTMAVLAGALPIAGILVASLLQAAFSYLAYRHLVFR